VLLGDQAKALSANVLGRLKAQWGEEYKLWSQGSLGEKQYVYWGRRTASTPPCAGGLYAR
jgi:hypothetical protein